MKFKLLFLSFSLFYKIFSLELIYSSQDSIISAYNLEPFTNQNISPIVISKNGNTYNLINTKTKSIESTLFLDSDSITTHSITVSRFWIDEDNGIEKIINTSKINNNIPEFSFKILDNDNSVILSGEGWITWWGYNKTTYLYSHIIPGQNHSFKLYKCRELKNSRINQNSNVFYNNSIKINQFNDKIIINLTENSGILNFKITNLLGKKIIEKDINLNSRNSIAIDLNQISAGIYLTKFKFGNTVFTKKINNK